MKDSRIFKLVLTGLLIAIGILIPMYSPVRFMVEPVSYTLGSHIAIFVAMFISPKVAVAVALGTTLGFFVGGFPLVIVLRAASHVIFALLGAIYLSRVDKKAFKGVTLRIFSFVMALIHAGAEALVVIFFFFGTTFPEGQTVGWILFFIGFGTVIHSMIDLELANIIRKVLQKQSFVDV